MTRQDKELPKPTIGGTLGSPDSPSWWKEDPGVSKKLGRFTQRRHHCGRQHLAVSTRLQQRSQGVVEVLSAPSYKDKEGLGRCEDGEDRSPRRETLGYKPPGLYPMPSSVYKGRHGLQ